MSKGHSCNRGGVALDNSVVFLVSFTQRSSRTWDLAVPCKQTHLWMWGKGKNLFDTWEMLYFFLFVRVIWRLLLFSQATQGYQEQWLLIKQWLCSVRGPPCPHALLLKNKPAWHVCWTSQPLLNLSPFCVSLLTSVSCGPLCCRAQLFFFLFFFRGSDELEDLSRRSASDFTLWNIFFWNCNARQFSHPPFLPQGKIVRGSHMFLPPHPTSVHVLCGLFVCGECSQFVVQWSN